MIALGSDHAGFPLKEAVRLYLDKKGVPYHDFGAYNTTSCDYPDMAIAPCRAVVSGNCRFAFLFCGTGIGISIAANKIKGIRAAVCSDYFSAKYTRIHNDANVLCLGQRIVGEGLAYELIDIFLEAEFEGERHAARIQKITDIEGM